MNKMTPHQVLTNVSLELAKHKIYNEDMTLNKIHHLEQLREYVIDQVNGVFSDALQGLPEGDYLDWHHQNSDDGE